MKNKVLNQSNEIEEFKHDLEEDIKRRDQLERLYQNKDFQELFLKHYFVNEAARCVALRQTDEALNNQKLAQNLDLKIIGIGECQKFLQAVKTLGSQAEMKINEMENGNV